MCKNRLNMFRRVKETRNSSEIKNLSTTDVVFGGTRTNNRSKTIASAPTHLSHQGKTYSVGIIYVVGKLYPPMSQVG